MKPDSFTLADIVAALEDQGVKVRDEYWSGGLERRKVYIEMTPVDLQIKAIKVDKDGDIHVIQGDLPDDHEHVEELG